MNKRKRVAAHKHRAHMSKMKDRRKLLGTTGAAAEAARRKPAPRKEAEAQPKRRASATHLAEALEQAGAAVQAKPEVVEAKPAKEVKKAKKPAEKKAAEAPAAEARAETEAAEKPARKPKAAKPAAKPAKKEKAQSGEAAAEAAPAEKTEQAG